MSISKFKDFIQSSGCGIAVSIAIALIMVMSVVGQCAKRSGPGDQGEGEEKKVVATAIGKVGSTDITLQSLEQNYTEMQAQFGKTELVSDQALIYAAALRRIANDAAQDELATSKSVTVDDAAVKKQAEEMSAFQVENFKNSLIQQKKLKAGASQPDIDKAMSEATQGKIKSEADAKKFIVDKTLAEPSTLKSLKSTLIRQKLNEAMASGTTLSDDDLKASYSTLAVVRVFINKKPGTDSAAKIKKVEDELKAGKSFESVVDTYSEDEAITGKKKSESQRPISGFQMFSNPEYAPFKTAKDGFVTGVIESELGYEIIKLIKKTSGIPPNFEKEKETQRKSILNMVGGSKVEAELKKLAETAKWTDPTFDLLSKYSLAIDPATGELPSNKIAEFASVEPIKSSTEGVQQIANLIVYKISNSVWKTYSDADKTKNADRRVAILQSSLQTADGPEIHLELAETLRAKGDKSAAEELMTAATRLHSVTSTGQKIFSDIGAELAKQEAAKLISPEQAKEARAALEEWKKTKAQADAEEKKQAEEQRKAEEAAKKEQAEQEKKAKASEDKPKLKTETTPTPPKK